MFTISSTDTDPESPNEIFDYMNACWLSASKVTWQILQFDIIGQAASWKSQSNYLPGRSLAEMICKNQVKLTGSSLAQYFLQPKLPGFRQLRYTKFNEPHSFYPFKMIKVKTNKKWSNHKNKHCITRNWRINLFTTTSSSSASLPLYRASNYYWSYIFDISGSDIGIRTVW